MRVPNTVIVGVPKCGTTSVFSYLADHPEVCPASQKETYFLMDQGHPLYRPNRNYAVQGIDGYAAFFAACAKKAKVFLEATPDYFYQNTAFQVLSDFRPKPLILFLLRDPASRVYSLFQFAKYHHGLFPADYPFAEFTNNLLFHCGEGYGDIILNSAVEHGKYVEYIKCWRDAFGPERTRIFLFEALMEDPAAFMRKVCGFLNIAPNFYDRYDFEQKNPTHAVRSMKLLRLKNRIRRYRAKAIFKPFVMPLYTRLNVRNGRIAKTPGDVEAINRLKAFYAEYNYRLQALTGLDISQWSGKESGGSKRNQGRFQASTVANDP